MKMQNSLLIPLVIGVTIVSTLFVTYLFQSKRIAANLGNSKASEGDWGSAQNNPTGPNTTVYVYGLTDRDFGTWFVESFLDPDPEASVRTGPMEIER